MVGVPPVKLFEFELKGGPHAHCRVLFLCAEMRKRGTHTRVLKYLKLHLWVPGRVPLSTSSVTLKRGIHQEVGAVTPS